MISAEPSLAAWIASTRHCLRPDLLTVETRTGLLLRWTDADRDITTADGRTFVRGPIIERSRLRLASGVQVDELSLSLYVGDDQLIGNVPMLHYARRGGFDGADVRLEWAYFDLDGTLKGTVLRFTGRTGPAEVERGAFFVSVRSELAGLNISIPRETYQPSCLNQVYDAKCGLVKSSFTVSGTVTGTNDTATWLLSNLGQSAGYFDLGVLTFTSGANAGHSRTVKAYAAGAFQFANPLGEVPSVGDTFTVRPGCDRRKTTCSSKFGNVVRFRGFPYVPAPETVA